MSRLSPPPVSAMKDSRGVPLLKALFREFNTEGDKSVITPACYTLAREDKWGLPSLQRLYFEADDISEVSFVSSCLVSWDHWERLQKVKELQPHFRKWREELRQKKISEAVSVLERDALDSESRTRTSSAKFLINDVYGYKKKAGGAGRPRKGNPAADEAGDAAVVSDAFERVFKVYKGGES